jgi:hypothetical protein
MIQKEVILIILIGIVIFLIINNDQVRPFINSLPKVRNSRRRESMTNDLSNDMYLIDNATINDKQSDNSLMYNQSNEESENKINNDMHKQSSDDMYGQSSDANMPKSEDKLYGSLYGQALQGNMHAEDNEGNMHNNRDKLYGSLYGQALQGNMNDEEDNEGNMPKDEEKLYGSLYGQSIKNDMQNSMNNSIPMPMDLSLDFDKPMELKMDMPMDLTLDFDKPIDFNKSINSSMDMSKFGENIMKEKMFNMDMNMGMMCPAVYDPVTCPNGQTYSNSCEAANAGQDSSKCKSGFPTIKENMWNFNNNSSGNYNHLVGSNINNISSELDKLKSSGMKVRVLFPGSKATMDFRPDRINLKVGDNGIVNSVNMG